MKKIWRNLFGDGSKIHADEIAVGSLEDHGTLSRKLEVVELWSGNAYEVDRILTLNEPIADFTRLDFRISASGQEIRTWYPKLMDYVDFKTVLLTNQAANSSLRVFKMRIRQQSPTTLLIEDNTTWWWAGNLSSTPTIEQNAGTTTSIYDILGYR